MKGYTIGIDVFDRPQAFNADSDPLVRVHAGKLRKLLAAYYAAEGAGDAWRIDIPKGTYVPEYLRQRVAPSATAETGPFGPAAPGCLPPGSPGCPLRYPRPWLCFPPCRC